MTPNDMPPHVQMMHMVMGHWVGQTANAMATLAIADHLGDATRSAADLAKLAGADTESLDRLLRAAASVGLLREVEPHHYALTPLGATLKSDVPGSMRDFVMAELAPGHWLPWGRLPEAIRTGKNQTQEALGASTWDYYAKNEDEGKRFARAMGNLSAHAVSEVLPSYDFSRFERIVDVGGSEGVLLAGALKLAPKAQGVLLDRPEVIARARGAIQAHGLGGRLEAVGGDFMKEVPAGADLYLLKSILHDWSDEPAKAILANVAKAARKGAKVLLIEMVAPDRVSPSPVYLMDLNMLVMVDGKERTAAQFKALYESAGLTFERVVPTKGMFCIVEGSKA